MSEDAQVVGTLLGAVLAVTLVTSLWAVAWMRHHARLANEWKRWAERPLSVGTSILHGRVETDDAAAIEIEIEQERRLGKRSDDDDVFFWMEVRRRSIARPFDLVREDGERVRVEPDDRTRLEDDLEPGERTGDRRTVVARLEPGESVFVTGMLSRDGHPGQGAYRGGAARWVLRPPKVGTMSVSTLAGGWRNEKRAEFHSVALITIVFLAVITEAVGGGFVMAAIRERLGDYKPGDGTALLLVVMTLLWGICLLCYAFAPGVFGLTLDGWFDEKRLSHLENRDGDPFRKKRAREDVRAEESAPRTE